MIEKIVSGAQTGVDRAALDVARELGVATGGWVPRGRRAEDGAISRDYAGLVETASEDPAERTACNVRDSDATLILCAGPPRGGTALTFRVARRLDKPLLVVDPLEGDGGAAAAAIRGWLATTRPRILNVAGPRRSEAPELADAAPALLRAALRGAVAGREGAVDSGRVPS